jgi:hypothetical protein
MADDPATDAPDNPAVTMYQRCERSVVPVLDETVEKLSIGQCRFTLLDDYPTKIPNRSAQLADCHVHHPLDDYPAST